MLVEVKQAFYNEETGAVQPWRDIEVDDTLGNELVSEGLVAAIAAGGGGGGESVTWLIEDVAVEAEYNEVYDAEGALFDFSDVLDEATFVSTFSGKTLVSVLNGVKVEAPGYVVHYDDYPEYDQVSINAGFDDSGNTVVLLLQKSSMGAFIYATAGTTITWSLGIVEE